jgi:DUF971 family protein
MDLLSSSAAVIPKAVRVNVTSGTGVEIDWKDGHQSVFPFGYLRTACPCALCDEEREQDGREPWDAPKPVANALPVYKPPVRPTEAKPVGKYALTFNWNDGHHHGIYSWEFLRKICPCAECVKGRTQTNASTEQ